MSDLMILGYIFVLLVYVGCAARNEKKLSFIEEKNSDRQCDICYERCPFYIRSECGHEMCSYCFHRILKPASRKCPLCRKHFDKRFEFHLYQIIFQKLFETKIPIEYLQNALPLLCHFGSVEQVRHWVENYNLKVTAEGFMGYYPIILSNSKKMSEYLISKGANAKEVLKTDKINPLHFAAEIGDFELVKHLVDELKLPVDGKRIDDVTALWLAAHCGYYDIVEFLLERDANVNNANKTNNASVLWIAVQNGHLEVVNLLIYSGADVNSPLKDNRCPLYLAVQNQYYEIAKLLVDGGAEIDVITEEKTTTPFWIACEDKEGLELVEHLFKRGANIEHKRFDGGTPLAVAVYKEIPDIAKFLLRNNANVKDVIDYYKNHHNKHILENYIPKLLDLYEEVMSEKQKFKAGEEVKAERKIHPRDITHENVSNKQRKRSFPIGVNAKYTIISFKNGKYKIRLQNLMSKEVIIRQGIVENSFAKIVFGPNVDIQVTDSLPRDVAQTFGEIGMLHHQTTSESIDGGNGELFFGNL